MKKILLVDDEQDIVETLKFVLESEGYTCYCAYNGEDGLKLAKEIMVAAKGGSPDPNQNAALRLAVDKAKAQNMPKDNIQKAIEKATGGADGANYETVRYEGYGHGGVAFMVDCLTDNRNRTASQVRSCFTKAGGNLGTDGSVSYMFERRGSIVIPSEYDETIRFFQIS